jgi:hypothetical protein
MLVTTLTSWGVAGAELKPNRTAGRSGASPPRLVPRYSASAAVIRRAAVTP